MTTTTIPITKARINLGALVKRVGIHKESFVLEKDGFPVAGLVNLDLLEDLLELRSETSKNELLQSQLDYKAGKVKKLKDLLSQ